MMMLSRSLVRRTPILVRGKATASREFEGQAESTKRAANSIFSKGMLPLVMATVVVGFIGYNFRKGVQIGPEDSTLAKQNTSMEDLKKQVKGDRELVQKTIQAVDKDRDKEGEQLWSKGTLEKNSFEASPENSPNKKPSDIRK